MVLTLIGELVDISLTQATRGRNPKGENENGEDKEARRQGAAILYLTGLFYIPLNVPG
jgi:hypothetical protein